MNTLSPSEESIAREVRAFVEQHGYAVCRVSFDGGYVVRNGQVSAARLRVDTTRGPVFVKRGTERASFGIYRYVWKMEAS